MDLRLGWIIRLISKHAVTSTHEIHVFTYLDLWFREEKGPTVLQRTRFWAALEALFQVMSCACSSAAASRLLEFLLLALGIPGKGLACNAGWWFSQGVRYIAPLPTSYFHLHWLLPSFPRQVFIWDPFRLPDVENAPETGVIEGLDPLQGCFRSPPGLCSIQ